MDGMGYGGINALSHATFFQVAAAPLALSDRHSNLNHHSKSSSAQLTKAAGKKQFRWVPYQPPALTQLHAHGKPNHFNSSMTLALEAEIKHGFNTVEAKIPPSPVPLSSRSSSSSPTPIRRPLNRSSSASSTPVARAPACKNKRRASVSVAAARSDRSVSPAASHTSEDLDAPFVPVVVDGEQQPVKCTHCSKTYRQHNSYFKHL